MAEGTEKQVVMTVPEVEALVERTVEHTLQRFGIDTTDPEQVQRDFHWVRDWRVSSNMIKARAMGVAIGVLIVGTLGLLWVGFKDAIFSAFSR